jgi:hypothetical protein
LAEVMIEAIMDAMTSVMLVWCGMVWFWFWFGLVWF